MLAMPPAERRISNPTLRLSQADGGGLVTYSDPPGNSVGFLAGRESSKPYTE